MEINLLFGIGIATGVLSLYKITNYWFKVPRKKFKIGHFLRDNWGDYVIHLGITALTFIFEHDMLNTINPLIKKLGVTWQIPHPENKGFLFVIIPIVISVVLYPIFRKFFSKPLQAKVSPEIYKETCEH